MANLSDIVFRRPPFNRHIVGVSGAFQRRHTCRADLDNTGKRPDTLFGPLEKGNCLRVLRVPRARKRNAEHQYIVWIESWINLLKPEKAPDHQTSTNNEH